MYIIEKYNMYGEYDGNDYNVYTSKENAMKYINDNFDWSATYEDMYGIRYIDDEQRVMIIIEMKVITD
jgi:hypothetical protein